MKIHRLTIALYLVFFTTKAIDIVPIFEYKFMIDSTNQSFINVSTLPDSNFSKRTGEPNETMQPYWIRIKVYNADIAKSHFINSPFIFYKNLEFYYQKGDSIYAQKAGINDFFSDKPYISGSQLFQLPNYKDTLICHIRCEPFYTNFFELVTFNSVQVVEQFNRRFPEFFSMGITFLATVFSILLFFYLKEKTYLFYSFFSISLLLSRMVHSGDIFNFTHLFIEINNLHQIYSLYTFTYVLITVTCLLYFKHFLSIDKNSPFRINTIINILIYFRVIILLIFIFFPQYSTFKLFDSEYNINNRWVDFIAMLGVFPMVLIYYLQNKNHKIIAIFAFISAFILIIGNSINLLQIQTNLYDSFTSYLHISSLEVVLFLSALGYRYHFLKKENEKSLLLIIEKMKETDALKDSVNRGLELKVAERTEEIRKMNEVLKEHNIQLANKAEDASKARLFQENMSYEEFKSIFADDSACATYLSDLKWGRNKIYKCKKCGYGEYKLLENYSRRCRSCNYIESPTNGTLFFNTKFSLHKAFYITYLTSTGTKQLSMEEISKQIDLRTGTYWKFHKKVEETMEAFKKSKKRKDGNWTQLIEFSIE